MWQNKQAIVGGRRNKIVGLRFRSRNAHPADRSHSIAASAKIDSFNH